MASVLCQLSCQSNVHCMVQNKAIKIKNKIPARIAYALGEDFL
jgi:hypothetical protein